MTAVGAVQLQGGDFLLNCPNQSIKELFLFEAHTFYLRIQSSFERMPPMLCRVPTRRLTGASLVRSNLFWSWHSEMPKRLQNDFFYIKSYEINSGQQNK
jgi:hypothetical protein